MYHSFDVTLAKIYGLTEAILLNHFFFWILKNQKNNKHYYQSSKDGKFYYWTYNSRPALQELFPYLSLSTIRRTLDGLIEKGILLVDNFNETTYDRTMWYAISDEVYFLIGQELPYDRNNDANKPQSEPCAQNDTSMCSNQHMHVLKMTHAYAHNNTSMCSKTQMDVLKKPDGSVQNDAPIPDKITDIIPDILTDLSKKVSNNIKSRTPARVYARESYEDLMIRLGFGQDLRQKIFEFIQFLKLNGIMLTNKQLEEMLFLTELKARDAIGISHLQEGSGEYAKEIEEYIGLSVQQALDSRNTKLIAVKNYKSWAEQEAEAAADLAETMSANKK